MCVVRVDELRKSYGDVTAVDDISFQVWSGEIFGIVGPNGAGKTTVVECLEGLREADSGRIEVLGLDVRKRPRELKGRIGVQLQSAMIQPRLRVWEAMDLQAALYDRALDWHTLVERFGLADKLKAPFAKLSGGQKQRLFIALALINDPELLFLDELTTGLDPQARRAAWEVVREIRSRGKTIVLTTHSMEEAEHLCDRVVIMDRGRIVALDSPANLIASLGGDTRITFEIDETFEPTTLKGLKAVSRFETSSREVVVYGSGPTLVADVVVALTSNGHRLRGLRTENASLEDVFLALTGKEIRD